MTASRPCASCGETTGFLVQEALIPNYEYSNSAEPLTLTVANLDEQNPGLLSSTERVSVKLSARACGGCGRVELFAKDLAVLERFAAANAGDVRKLCAGVQRFPAVLDGAHHAGVRAATTFSSSAATRAARGCVAGKVCSTHFSCPGS